jgi:hypothetical protein
MPFDLAELSVGELRSSDRIRDEAKCSGSASGALSILGAVVLAHEWQLPAFVSDKMQRNQAKSKKRNLFAR